MDLTIGVDLGGTKIAAAVVDDQGVIHDRVQLATPSGTAAVPDDRSATSDGIADRTDDDSVGAEAVESSICSAIERLTARHRVGAVGLAVAGFVDAGRSTLRFAPNLPMRDRPLREVIGYRVGLPVVVENDANAAAWAEHRFGAGTGVPDVVMLTVGTGLGGGIVLEGRLLRGAFGGAAELGHVRMVPGGLPCGCGNHGCWEQYTSGRALVREAQALARSEPQRAARLLDLAGGRVEAIDGRMVTRAAKEGDAAARSLLASLGRWLGEGIADLADVLDPAMVVIGGGVCEAGDLLLGPAREAYAAVLSAGEYRPHLRIVAAELGNDAGMVGAADLARIP